MHKKQKDNKEVNTSHMDDEEVTTVAKSLQKSSQTSFNELSRKHNQFISNIIDILTELGRTIEEVKTTVDHAS